MSQVTSYLRKEFVLALLCLKSFNLLLNSLIFFQIFYRCPLTMKIRAKKNKITYLKHVKIMNPLLYIYVFYSSPKVN